MSFQSHLPHDSLLALEENNYKKHFQCKIVYIVKCEKAAIILRQQCVHIFGNEGVRLYWKIHSYTFEMQELSDKSHLLYFKAFSLIAFF